MQFALEASVAHDHDHQVSGESRPAYPCLASEIQNQNYQFLYGASYHFHK